MPLCKSIISFIICCTFSAFAGIVYGQPAYIEHPPEKREVIKGISFVAPPKPFDKDPMHEIKNVNAEWIAVIPYGFIPQYGHEVSFGAKQYWWGEGTEGVKETIRIAKEKNLKVMLKPQVWIRGEWVGSFTAGSEENWKSWETSFRNYILEYTDIACQMNVEMICIGTEFKKAVEQRPEFWKSLIKDIRKIYDGKITYSSNWDNYKSVPFWNEVDYIGISAYFPLTKEKTPSHTELRNKWKPIVKNLRQFSKKHNKPILFTEFGYLSLDGCAGKTWILEKEREEHEQNEEAQSNAIHCLLETFWEEDFWAGGFIWKWYPELSERRKNYYLKDYTPQGKMAEQTLSQWYNK